MNLGFMTKWDNGEPTYFVEKIWAGLNDEKQHDIYFNEYCEKFSHSQKDNGWSITFNDTNRLPKIHTIREDKKDRWRVGNKIHFVINNRQPNRFQFAPVIECTGVQTIEIEFIDFYKNGVDELIREVTIDGQLLSDIEVEELAKNDGFKNADDFFCYFSKSEYFKGKIIHWTNKRY